MTRPRRIVAARYLRTLSAIECMVALGNYSEVRRLCNAIDHLEARELADELDRAEPTQIPQLRLIERVEEYSIRV